MVTSIIFPDWSKIVVVLIEVKNDHQLDFLNVLITRRVDGAIKQDIYHNPT